MPPRTDKDQEYVAIIDQDKVTEEVRNIAVKYDPLNRSGREGFHVTDDGELHIDDAMVIEEHKLIAKKIPNDAIEIVPLPAATGELVHQYGQNGFRLYELPVPKSGGITGLLGRNGIGKSTAVEMLAGKTLPNFGEPQTVSNWEQAAKRFRGTVLQQHLEQLDAGTITTAYKPQRVTDLGNAGRKTVSEQLPGGVEQNHPLLERLELTTLLDQTLDSLSGGERQRLAIALTLLSDADLYVFDEPSSFLDVSQRLIAGRVIREWVDKQNAAAIVVEHDLVLLDLLADDIHVIYGEPGSFGVVSQRLPVREGINQFLEGRLKQENVQIRRQAITIPAPSERSAPQGSVAVEYPALSYGYETFELTVEPGAIHDGEAVGIVGANALGKTTFAKLLAGALEPDDGTAPQQATVAYKPQYLSADTTATVRTQIAQVTNVNDQEFKTRIQDPFGLEELYDRPLNELSGGELQRVGIALCLARDADLYLLDEPSAFLDVDRRVSLANQLHRFARRGDNAVLVIDHDLLLMNRIADRLIVFEGIPGRQGNAHKPTDVRTGMNRVLETLDVSFRRDDRTGRPRVNKPGSQLDRQQKRKGEYFY